MLTIYLARHGQDKDNLNGILNGHRNQPLTEKGKEQAVELAQKILHTGLKFDKIYSSPLIKTLTTAEIISSVTQSPTPVIDNLLIERDFGILTGQPHSKIIEMCGDKIIKTDTVTYFLSPKEAETFPDLIIRAKKILAEINSKHQTGKILLVTHGDIGKMVYAAYYSLPWKQVLKQFHFGNSDLLILSGDSKPKDSHVFKIKQHNL